MKASLDGLYLPTVLLKWSCRMHVENLGTSWMLGRSQNLISDSNKLLRIFNEFQCILFVLLLEAPISFNLWQQDSALGADRSMTTFVPFALPRTKDAKSLSWWGARPTYGVSTGDLCWKFVIVMNCTFFIDNQIHQQQVDSSQELLQKPGHFYGHKNDENIF